MHAVNLRSKPRCNLLRRKLSGSADLIVHDELGDLEELAHRLEIFVGHSAAERRRNVCACTSHGALKPSGPCADRSEQTSSKIELMPCAHPHRGRHRFCAKSLESVYSCVARANGLALTTDLLGLRSSWSWLGRSTCSAQRRPALEGPIEQRATRRA